MTDVANIRIVVDTRDLKAANEELKRHGKEGEEATKKVKDGFNESSKAVDFMKKAIAALGLAALAKSLLDTSLSVEKMRGALVTATGSVGAANLQFNKLLDFASTTPFTLDQSVDAFVKLKNLGLDPSERSLRSYGNTAAAMGKDMSQMIEAVADASTFEFERLKEFGIKAKQQADSVTFTFAGVSTTVGKTSKEIQEYLLNIGETKFATAMEEQMKRLPGLFSNMKDNITKLFIALGDAGAISIFGAGMTLIADTAIYLQQNIDQVTIAIQAAGAAMLVAFGPAMIMSIITSVGALWKVVAKHPFIAVASAVAALAVVIYRNWDAVKTATERLWIEIRLSWESFKIAFLTGFGGFINGLINGWESMKNIAIAAFAGIAAAAKDPLNPLDSFTRKFKQTMDDLQRNTKPVEFFSDAIDESRQNVFTLANQLVELNRRTSDTERLAEDGADAIEELGDAAAETAIEFENMADYVKEYNERAKKAEESTRSVIEKIREERDALGLSGLQLEIHNRLRGLAVGATEEMRQAVIDETTALYNAQEAHRDQEKSLELLTQGYEKITTSISGFFYDLFTNGKSAFDSLVDAFMDMLARIAAAWAASNVMSFLTGGQIPRMSIGQAASSVLGQGVMSAGGAILGNVGGTIGSSIAGAMGMGTLSTTGGWVAPSMASPALLSGAAPAAAPAGGGLLSGIGSSLAAGAKAVWGGITNIASMIPGWGWALGGIALAASLLDKSGTMSGNNGFLTAPVPGVSSDQYQAGAPFASGYQPLIFNRRGSVEDATAITDGFRAVDSAIVGLFRAGGIELRVNPGEIAGYNENGTGRGVFFGAATEDGDATGTSLDDQLTSYARQMFLIASGKGLLPDQYLNPILAAGSYDQMIQKAVEMAAAEGILVDGSHAEGLKKVPRDGYVAELHAGERVLTMEQAIAADSMAQDISMLKGSLEEIMFAVAKNTNKLWRINDRWDKDGMPPVRS